MIRLLVLVITVSALIGCGPPHRCAFTYDQDIANKIVLPAARSAVPDFDERYNKNPEIEPNLNIFYVVFHPNGASARGPRLVVAIAPCTNKIVRIIAPI